MKHSDYITHIDNEEDEVYLKSKHFPVNMRLFKTSKQYREIILQQCNYIRELCLDTKDGYKKPHGMSSANAGLAFNIIGITRNRNTKDEYCEIMINPEIIGKSEKYYETISNCGSLTLKDPIKILRHIYIEVKWFNEDGEENRKIFVRSTNSSTIEHEIEHNLGILITDLNEKVNKVDFLSSFDSV